eukprot:1887948-Rhodomonas_salina.1
MLGTERRRRVETIEWYGCDPSWYNAPHVVSTSRKPLYQDSTRRVISTMVLVSIMVLGKSQYCAAVPARLFSVTEQ